MLIAWFHEIGSAHIDLVGGKGANLGEMTRAGLPVPPGFCITATAYRQLIAEAGIWSEIAALLDTTAPDQRDLSERATAIRSLIMQSTMPSAIATAIRAAYAELAHNGIAVAVRSSATAEDLPDASFAGQQETYLGIRGVDALLSHIQRCWASLWTERAIAYREHNGFPHTQVSLAVVIQAMVAPDMAGVLFTANPVTGRRDELVINAAYGLGESVVAGHITPDTYRLSRAKRVRVIERSCGTKAQRVDALPAGGTMLTPVPPSDQTRLCLTDRHLHALVTLGLRVESHYGTPQDIEWALANGQLYLLQTRPVTTLGHQAKNATRPLNRIEHMIGDDILEHYPDPPYPLDYGAVTEGYEQLQHLMRAAGVAVPSADTIICMDDMGIPTVVPITPRPTWRLLQLPWLIRDRLKIAATGWSQGPGAGFAVALADLRRSDEQLAALDGHTLARYIERAVMITTVIGRIRFANFIAPLMMRSALLQWWLRLAGEAAQVSEMDLLGGLAYKTAQIDQALQRLVAEATALEVRVALFDLPIDAVQATLEQTAEGRLFLTHVALFLAEHGARTMKVYLPFSNTSWCERPANLFATLAAIIRANPTDASEQRAEAARVRYTQLRDRIVAKLPPPLRQHFLATLEEFRAGHIAREASLYAIEEAFVVARQGVREAAQRLVTAGVLPAPADVIFLTLPELGAALREQRPSTELYRLVTRRRSARSRAQAAWRQRTAVAHLQTSDGTLKGLAGSPGMVTGPVKIIGGPAEFNKLQPGDVLVCTFTDPAWTPLFALAAAVVADTGGSLSHAAIVAREYGIPAVLGTQTATTQLHDGVIVTVDGSSGVVRMG